MPQIISTYFVYIGLTHTKYFRLAYNKFNKPCKLTQWYKKQSLLAAYKNIKTFMQVHEDRHIYACWYEPDLSVPLKNDTFN